MSCDNDDGFWVNKCSEWISYASLNRGHREECRAVSLERDIAEIGNIALFAGKFISSERLMIHGINSDGWRWSLHEAEIALGDAAQRHEIERRFIKKLLDLGKNYAVARYAQWENLSFETALTSVYPYGIRALLYQYISSEKLLRDSHFRPIITRAIKDALEVEEMVAYDRTSIIQRTLHELANTTMWPGSHLGLDRDNIRTILSLCRLHFTSLECKIDSIAQLRQLSQRYEHARKMIFQGITPVKFLEGRSIPNWKLRHLHSLIYYYPYGIRNCLGRSTKELTDDTTAFTRDHAINEIALAHCEIKMMRQKSINRNNTK